MNPTVSIIIPVYNDSKAIYNTLTKLEEQNYPKENYEIIVVDNGSTDDTVKVVEKFENVSLLFEHFNLSSPYSARNRGIEKARGDIIVLLDSTCFPSKNWLLAGVSCLYNKGADIVGGEVAFDFGNNITAGKIYDSITNIKMRESILEKQVAKTANLFIKKEVFDEVGKFPEGVRSGADVRWTRKAVTQGCKMVYCEKAYVEKIARPFFLLVKKQWRVGLAQPEIWKEEGRQTNILWLLVRIFIPIRPKNVRENIMKSGSQYYENYYYKLVLTGQVISIVMKTANLVGFLRNKLKKII
ncbi:glycosyltransferase [Natranaerofaba carboxydovora]|uniref:glycosyltransferase n=1 Tax=Natranaerofaba carboxydovora TaxID=2742683 RepID=UPI001F13E182|nr:glycosyltransferase [Natranaerofaba carboxydovora]UMZ74718.1 Putative mycofactocin biosynthesis glycosyltransferase MftF [Natranaerofaba carboxydovora]